MNSTRQAFELPYLSGCLPEPEDVLEPCNVCYGGTYCADPLSCPGCYGGHTDGSTCLDTPGPCTTSFFVGVGVGGGGAIIAVWIVAT